MCSPRRAASSALREEGDGATLLAFLNVCNFYPRPPRGGRLTLSEFFAKAEGFLSTPSARRATGRAGGGHHSGSISIHALREEGDLEADLKKDLAEEISIHALREEGDIWMCRETLPMVHFYPRPPRGGRRFFPDFWRF